MTGQAHGRLVTQVHDLKGERRIDQGVVFDAQLQRTAQIGTAENGIAQHTELVDVDGCAQIQTNAVVRVVTNQILSQEQQLLIGQSRRGIFQYFRADTCVFQ